MTDVGSPDKEPSSVEARSETVSDDDKWVKECQFREREVFVKEQDIQLRRDEVTKSRWRSPLTVAILAAAAAATGNGLVAFLNGQEEQSLEITRAESARILEMIKTGNADKAAENLRFLADAGLIENQKRLDAIRQYLQSRAPGLGTSLPPTSAPVSDKADTLSTFRKAIALNPTDVSGYENLARALIEQGEISEAVLLLRKAIALNPNDATAHANLGLALSALERYEDAIVEFKEALMLDPRNADLHKNISAILMTQGKREEAAIELRISKELKAEEDSKTK